MAELELFRGLLVLQRRRFFILITVGALLYYSKILDNRAKMQKIKLFAKKIANFSLFS